MAEAVASPLRGITILGRSAMSNAIITTLDKDARDHEAIIGVPTKIETAKATDHPIPIAGAEVRVEAEEGAGVGAGAYNEGTIVRHTMAGLPAKRQSWKGYLWILQKQTFAPPPCLYNTRTLIPNCGLQA